MTSPDDAIDETYERSPLEERLIAIIRANGPISIADYMEDALFHPHDGYYAAQNAIGAEGDFTTAPEISQIFGELIGLWLVQSWEDIGAPSRFNLIEIGPGRGVLMADILRAARLRPKFMDALHLWLVETSGRMRHEQKKRIDRDGLRLDWADDIDDVPMGPSLIIANELLDCLPIRQFIYGPRRWHERLVDVADGRLVFAESRTPADPAIALPNDPALRPGEIYEVCDGAVALVDKIVARFLPYKGRALFFDYSIKTDGRGDTLQAIRRHKSWPVLAAPGLADITAHVDFARLNAVAFANGAAAFGPVTQAAFLDRLGLAMRVERLTATASPDQAKAIRAGVTRLVDPTQMGELFKAFAISSPDLPVPPGF